MRYNHEKASFLLISVLKSALSKSPVEYPAPSTNILMRFYNFSVPLNYWECLSLGFWKTSLLCLYLHSFPHPMATGTGGSNTSSGVEYGSSPRLPASLSPVLTVLVIWDKADDRKADMHVCDRHNDYSKLFVLSPITS